MVRIGPEGDKALRMGQGGTYMRTDVQIHPVFYRTASPSELLLQEKITYSAWELFVVAFVQIH